MESTHPAIELRELLNELSRLRARMHAIKHIVEILRDRAILDATTLGLGVCELASAACNLAEAQRSYHHLQYQSKAPSAPIGVYDPHLRAILDRIREALGECVAFLRIAARMLDAALAQWPTRSA